MLNIPLRVRNLAKRLATCNPDEIAKDLKITVIYGETPIGANGFWRRILRRKYICINEKLSGWQRKAVLSHEIAHILLHPHYTSYCMAGRTFFSRTIYEDEADEFAVELLSQSVDVEKEYIFLFLKEGWKRSNNHSNVRGN